MTTRVQVDNGKYEVVISPKGTMFANRYGEYWQDLTGSNLVYWLAVELENAREELKSIVEANAQ